MVFAARYLDIFTDYVSLYNTVMKLIFLGSSFSIVWYIRRHKIVRRSYDKDQDTFRHLFLILPCLLLALFINEKFTFKEVFLCSFKDRLYAFFNKVLMCIVFKFSKHTCNTKLYRTLFHINVVLCTFHLSFVFIIKYRCHMIY